MGTGKSVRCINTVGNARSVSDFVLVHSIEGEFTQPMRSRDRLRLKVGGHGQKGRLLLDKYGIQYNIVKTYPNGVKVGNIPDHTKRIKRTGIGQSWFPESWKTVYGIYKGVWVGVIRTKGKITTIFLDSIQPTKKRRKKVD